MCQHLAGMGDEMAEQLEFFGDSLISRPARIT